MTSNAVGIFCNRSKQHYRFRMHVLLVEDEKKTVVFLVKGLSENSITVDAAEDGLTGLSLATQNNYDIVVLDIMLPGCDGWTVLEKLRAMDKKTPVLFLTARDAIDDRVRGLELGADDYLVKPFAFSELLARIHAVTRRQGLLKPSTICAGDLLVDFTRHLVKRKESLIELTPKEFELLSLFAHRKGEVLTRRIIAREVWGIDFDTGTNVVDVAIRRLRAKVDDPFEGKLIHTIRGIGYVFQES